MGQEKMRTRLIDKLPITGPNAIFRTYQSKYSPKWLDFFNLTDVFEVDRAYMARSGQKLTSPYIDLMDNLGQSEIVTNIVDLINIKYGKNWDKLYSTLSLSYNPIENYSMTETESGSENSKRTPDLTETELTTPTTTRTTSRTSTPGVVETETETTNPDTIDTESFTDRKTNGKTSVYGFNSSDPVPSEEEENTETGSRTLSRSGSESRSKETSHSGSDTEDETITDGGQVSVDRTSTGSEINEGSHERTLRRSGNIGVTTSQQMIQSERDLWTLWNFFDQVFADLDKEITSPIYF